jgi:hypothetical protein
MLSIRNRRECLKTLKASGFINSGTLKLFTR